MKKITLFSLLLFVFAGVFAQKSNMVFFSQTGDKFYLILNGIQQNDVPLTNVKITGMAGEAFYQVRVKFENADLGIIDDKVSIENGIEKTWSIYQKKVNGVVKYAIKTLSQTELTPDYHPAPMPADEVIVFHTTTTAPAVSGDGVSINMGMNENGASMNINVGAGNTTTTSSSSSTTTTTVHRRTVNGQVVENEHQTISSNCGACISNADFGNIISRVRIQTTYAGKNIVATKAVNENCFSSQQLLELCNELQNSNDRLELAKHAYAHCVDPQNYDLVYSAFSISSYVTQLDDYIKTHPVSGQVIVSEPIVESTTIQQTVPPGGGCAYPMGFTDFNDAKKTIKAADFENTKLETAKTIVSSNCVTSEQVMEICKLFDFENSKLDFAKFAYSKVYDKSNYYKVGQVFEFDASKQTLNEYIKGR